MANTNVRVVGSGYTTLNYGNRPIAWLTSFSDTGQKSHPLVGQPEAITPLDARHPVEIVTGRVLGAGTLTATIVELWDKPVWESLQGLAGRKNLLDVWEALALSPTPVTCQIIIKPPNNRPWRGKTLHGVVITEIPDDESVGIGDLSVSRIIRMAYTHSTPLTG